MSRRVFQGVVVSDKCDKTITVRVVKKVKHPLYGKYIVKSAKYAAHDECNLCKVGQVVQIRECRPLSKAKSWEVVVGV